MLAIIRLGTLLTVYRSNAQGSLIHDLMRYARIEPQVLQVELHPYLTQEALIKYCQLLNIAVTAYSSFGPQSYVELGVDKKVPGLLGHDVVSAIAAKSGKSQYIFSLDLESTTHNLGVCSHGSGFAPLGSPAGPRCHSEVEQPRSSRPELGLHWV